VYKQISTAVSRITIMGEQPTERLNLADERWIAITRRCFWDLAVIPLVAPVLLSRLDCRSCFWINEEVTLFKSNQLLTKVNNERVVVFRCILAHKKGT
jgi:hypothetical protein